MSNLQLKFLVVDSKKEDALFYQRLLDKSPFLPFRCKVTHAKTLEESYSKLEKLAFHLIITNLTLEDGQGVLIFENLQKRAPHTPIVILTDQGDEQEALKIIAMGAQDYLLKQDLNVHFLSRIIRFAIERHQLQESLRDLSFKDELTGIYNRRGLMTLAEQQMELAKRQNRGFFFFLFDLDHLKSINDTYGHQEGDKALMEAALCLKLSFRSSDIVGRIGGDEFAVIALTNASGSDAILISNLKQTLFENEVKNPHPYDLSITEGVAYFDPTSQLSLEELIEEADTKLYAKKRMRLLQE